MDDRHHHVYNGPPTDREPPPPKPKAAHKPRQQSPQSTIHQFWKKFSTQHPGKVFAVLPSNSHARRKRHQRPSYAGKRVAKSYDEAQAECIRDVDRIIKECRRTNQKYRDLHFDIEWDLKAHRRDCLDGLRKSRTKMKPKGVKRVTDIFENPQFYINGPTAGDVRQGRDGDCYLMAALCGLGNMEGLIDRVCVKHDLQVGVYGFVFYRDGEWQQTIVDDKLYLKAPDYDEAQEERVVWDDVTRIDSEEEYRKTHQTGSRALYFAQCEDPNETWLPLLEKAYAKAHGDYSAIDGGFTGEAVEDLTGGVTTEIYSTDILDKEAFWKDELMHVNNEFLFGCATGFYQDWLDTTGETRERDRKGIDVSHAYSVMEAREVKGKRLLKVRNPWGRNEWTGKWSDGSSEWDAEWLTLLNHKFGNDGVFWISYEDLLKKYQHFDRTRIFDKDWIVSQAWVGVDVGWCPEYHSTRFLLTLKKRGPVVIVLSQLDDTYFDGLDGCYAFDLQFRLEEAKEDRDPNDYIVRSNGAYAMARSVSTDIELDAGTYVVLMKITARKFNDELLEDVLAKYVEGKTEKLIQMGLSYDLAHAKGVYVEGKEEKRERKRKAEKRKQEAKAKMKRKMRERAEKTWQRDKMRHDRERERRARKKKSSRIDDQVLDKSRQGSGSLDAQPAASAVDGELPKEQKQDNAHKNQQNGTKGESLPVRFKSFSGETIEVANAPIDSGAVAHAGSLVEETRRGDDLVSNSNSSQPGAENIVQPLDKVVQAAEDETKANKTTPPRVSTETSTTETEEKPQTPIIQVNGKDAITEVKPLPNFPPLSTPEHSLPAHPAPPNGSAMTTPGAPHRQNPFDSTSPKNEFRSADMRSDLDETGSMKSFSSFDWNSEIDIPSDYDYTSTSSSESDSDLDTNLSTIDPGDSSRPRSSYSHSSSSSTDGSIMYKPPVAQKRKSREKRRVDMASMAAPPEQGEGKEEVGEEPWNAVCVVGLRVYSRGEVGLEVVWGDQERKKKGKRRGKARETGEGKGEGGDGLPGVVMSPLDPDDQGKGMMSASTTVAAAAAPPTETTVDETASG